MPPTVASSLDLEFVRAQFPGLAGEWIFFDNAGGSQILGRVVERIADFLLHTNVQVGASYTISAQAGERLAESRRIFARYLGAARPEEIVHGASTTQLVANLAAAMRLMPGDEVIVTNFDHEANIGPWRRLAERGIAIKTWQINRDTLRLEPEELLPLLNGRTRLVAFSAASNVLGSLHPIAEITRLAHTAGAQVCVDAVAYAPHRAIDVQALGIDFLVLSTYKLYGPHAAVLYGRAEALAALRGINHFFIAEDEIPYKLQPGNANFELAWGCTGIVDYFEALARHQGGSSPADAFEVIARHEEALADRLLAFLTSYPQVRIWGESTADRERRVPTVSFTVKGRTSQEIVEAIDPHKIGIRWGDFYARRLIEDLGCGPVVRVSMVHYNSLAEVDRLIAGLAPLL